MTMASTPSKSTALTKGATDEPSKPAVSLNRQMVLDEDEYTSAISAIIARDFFPSLAHLDATNSYLSALDSEDSSRIEASIRRLADLGPTPKHRTPWDKATPYARTPSETPLRTSSGHGNSERAAKRPKYDTSLSLDAFQAKYTSEDNASFTEILDEENRQRKERWWWAWEAERKATECKAIEFSGREKLLLEAQGEGSSGRRTIEGPQTKTIEAIKDDETYQPGQPAERTSMEVALRAEDALVTTTNEASEPVDVMAPRKDTRSAVVPSWRFKTRNGLMFSPDADVSPYHPPPPSAGSDPSNAEASRGEPKLVKHANTRLPEQSEHVPDADVPPSPSRSRIGAAISGTPYRRREDDTPKVQGFGFVSALPSPSPSQLGPEAMKELMTWGTLLGTPRIIRDEEGGATHALDSAPSPFSIAQPSNRDALGRKLGGQASKSLREKAALLSGTPRVKKRKSEGGEMLPPSMTPRRGVGTLTPAARDLLSRTKSAGSLGLATTPLQRDMEDKASSLRGSKGKQLDLRKVPWSPMASPAHRGHRS